MPRSSTAIRGDGSKKRRRKPGLSNPRQSSAVTLDQNTTDGEIWGSSMAGTNENDAPTSLLELSENFDGHVQGSLVTGTSERGVPIKGDGPKKRGRKPGVSHPRRCETKTLAQSTIDEEIPAMAGNGDTEAPVKGDCPRKRGRKPGVSYPIKSKARALNQDTVDEESHGSSMASDSDNGAPVALFESSEKFLKFCDQLWLMYGASVDDSRWAQAKERFSSSVNFVQEWRQYWNEESKTLRFIHEGGSQHVNDNKKVIVLPQFSSAAVPKIEKVSPEITKITNSSNDFVMQVGGSVWALDWCPKTHQGPQSLVKCEYLAISAHPPDCSFHKIGVPLSGRGMIQLWSLLNVSTKGDSLLPQKSRVRKMTDRSETVDDVMEGTCGRAWTLNEGSMPGTSNIVGGPTTTTHIGFNHTDSSYLQDTVVSKGKSRIKDKARAKASDNISQMGSLALIEMNKTSTAQMYGNKNGAITKVDSVSAVLSKELAYPRIALCLTHEGKVAWDVKWRPPNGKDMENDESLGFMAVVLGDGSIQVWEIPSPVMLKSLYGCKSRKGTDPRFVKLLPVFKCSKLQCGNRQSIPLTVEWSPTIPHDLILVGCHDGMVALWKFSASGSSKDTRPILCFTADDLPIRALAWCPAESDEESSIFFATAGHSGSLRFWDIRDPFRPLWDLHLSRAVILSIDWSKDPRCVILSLDDGSLRILSLLNATSHVPVTGKPFVGTPLQGLQSYFCSPFAIWSVQISQATGILLLFGCILWCGRFCHTIPAHKQSSGQRIKAISHPPLSFWINL
ncbi:uncharacterized protein LOC18441339 isoform X2 [Amborella trichopoda]|uniref:uncharacterized protein LOC18441339 isoform X2 n=1 Tax=Amborella trichopoda TaxID=13333 RepID=UPI0009BFF4AD|nr:uncharacterized protein LOC18441339 isoform X2 [Amborella trichopoda]|eukprot:XP_020527307.1 uncharacterized protein LOC18441339 isoform X2 [Amborella trichopoda]